MSFFHEHTWRETERITTGPSGLVSFDRFGGSADELERLIWGITSIVLTCEGCGDKKVVDVKGGKR